MSDAQQTWETLNAVNVNGKTEKKEGLTYLSWAWAWAEVKQRFPDAQYEIKHFDNGLPYLCDPNTGYMVFTSVTINSITHEMWLPVMDGYNRAMKSTPYEITFKSGKGITVQAATMTDINKSIMRCLTKNLAMHGLGLYIYAGEDLPEADKPQPKTALVYETEIKAAQNLQELQDIFADAWRNLHDNDRARIKDIYNNRKADFTAEQETAA